ncbi:MAG: hypothetical protein WAM39_09265 [Bryobacteraceae bacterium]
MSNAKSPPEGGLQPAQDFSPAFRTLLACLAFTLPALAHVGSPDIYYEGNAGPYHLNVTIQMPQTVPGIATVFIRSTTAGISQMRLAPMALLESTKLSPTPDLAQQSAADPKFFTGHVWLMEPSGFQIHLQADGALGHGELGVPGTAMPQKVLPMQRGLGVLLFILMLFLSAGMVTIIGVSVREAQLEPGVIPSSNDVRKKRIAMVVGGIFVLAVLMAGNNWWSVEARSEIAKTQPIHLVASLHSGNLLALNLPDQKAEIRPGVYAPLWRLYAPAKLLPDHNHLMHLFLVRTPAMDQFWHLHPDPSGDHAWFGANLPSLPAGHYRLFADIVQITGAAPTLIGDIDLPDVVGGSLHDDDSGGPLPPLPLAAGDRAVCSLPGGYRMVWERDSSPLKARTYTVFRFHVEDKNGNVVSDLTPYMGMAGHAEFVRDDLSTFAHVHPMGDVSMAAVQLAEASYTNPPSNPHAGHMMMMHEMSVPPIVTFPYGFPQPGRYRIFVQVKRGGQILSGAFDATVNP